MTIALFLAGCVPGMVMPQSTRPVIKIGLLAPFEGLHRRSGYEALAAMRASISDHQALLNAARIDVLPLALDQGQTQERARRSAQKLIVDREMGGVVGPMMPTLVPGVSHVLRKQDVPWLTPFAVGQDGAFVDLSKSDPITGSVFFSSWGAEIAAQIVLELRQQKRERLVLAGWSGAEPYADEVALDWQMRFRLPVAALTDPAAVTASDGIFWLGDVAAAAVFLRQLHTQQPDVPMWIGPPGHDPVLADVIDVSGPLFWVTWIDNGYAAWADTHEPATPAAYLVYRATEQIILTLAGQEQPLREGWHLEFFKVKDYARTDD